MGLFGSAKTEVSTFEEIGLLSFARYFGLTMEETVTMINNPNETLNAMMSEMRQSMIRYENFMVKVKRLEKEGEELCRFDFLDFS